MAAYFQPYCTPKASSCIEEVSRQDLGCKVSCTGLYADKEYSDLTLYADRVLHQRMKEILTLAEKGLKLHKNKLHFVSSYLSFQLSERSQMIRQEKKYNDTLPITPHMRPTLSCPLFQKKEELCWGYL